MAEKVEYEAILIFDCEDEKEFKLTIPCLDNTKTDAEIKTCGTAIVTSGIFTPRNIPLVALSGAKRVMTTTTDVALV